MRWWISSSEPDTETDGERETNVMSGQEQEITIVNNSNYELNNKMSLRTPAENTDIKISNFLAILISKNC